MKKEKLTPVHVIDLAVRDDGYFTINKEANVSPFFVATEHFEPAEFLREFDVSYTEDIDKITEEQLMQRYDSGKGYISCTVKHINTEFRRKLT